MQLTEFKQQTGRLAIAGLKNDVSDDKPLVIALHGWLDNAASFIPLAAKLNQKTELNYRFFAMDLPGHGKSEHRSKSSIYNLVDNVLDVLALIDSLPNNERFTLVGHSLGGIIACLVAASVPMRVEKLVLLDSLGPLTDQIEQVLPQLRKAVSKAALLRNAKLNVYPSEEMAAKARMAGIGRVHFEAAKTLVSRGLVPVEGGFIWSSDSRLLEPSLLRFSEDQVRAIFAGIECPVSLIVGESGYFREFEAIKKRLSYIPNLEKHIVDGGHHFHMEGDVQKTAEILDVFVA